MGKKYLFVSDIRHEKDLADKVVNEFRKKAFLTDSILIFVAEKNEETFNYFGLFPCLMAACNIQVVLKGQIPVETMIAQVDYYIVGNNPNEIDYINCAIQNDIEIIGTMENAENIFSDIEIPAEVEKVKNNLYVACKDIFNNFPPSDYEYFLFHNGLGESMGFFYWLKEYKKTHHKKILLFCISNSHIDFMSVCPYVDNIIKIDRLAYGFIAVYFTEDYNVKNFYTLHLSENVLKRRKNFPMYLKYSGIFSSARDFLGINPKVELKKYLVDIPPERISNAEKIFNDMGLIRGKTVFFITEGISQNRPHIDFFIKLATVLQYHGYEVVTNSTQEIIPGCRYVFIPLLETSAFIGLCGNVVSVTTGFNEVICALNSKDKIKLSVVLPSKAEIAKNFIMNWQHLKSIQYTGRRKSENSFGKGYEYFLSLFLSKNIDYGVYTRGGGGDWYT